MEGLYVIIAFVVGFLVAQMTKTMIGMMSDQKPKNISTWQAMIGYFVRSGGMPSGHAASFTALTTYLGMATGFNSSVFALALGTLIIVLYDAIHVRYAVGEQGKALNEILRKAGKTELPVVEGHTLGQVVVGCLIGMLIGWLVFSLTSM